LNFTGSYDELQNKLLNLGGEWDENQLNKKVYRLSGALMNWFETTGTIQFQGRPPSVRKLENLIKARLYPEDYPSIEDISEIIPRMDEDAVSGTSSTKDKNVSSQFLKNEFDNSEIIIGLVSAVGNEVSRVTTPLKDRLKGFGY